MIKKLARVRSRLLRAFPNQFLAQKWKVPRLTAGSPERLGHHSPAQGVRIWQSLSDLASLCPPTYWPDGSSISHRSDGNIPRESRSYLCRIVRCILGLPARAPTTFAKRTSTDLIKTTLRGKGYADSQIPSLLDLDVYHHLMLYHRRTQSPPHLDRQQLRKTICTAVGTRS